LVFRTPVVPTVNDTEQQLAAIAEFVSQLRRARREAGAGGAGDAPIELELLPFHPLGLDKYESLGMENSSRKLSPIPSERFAELVRIARLEAVLA
jgi:pyruvate-formate lyase-activating enzyme